LKVDTLELKDKNFLRIAEVHVRELKNRYFSG